MYWKPHRLLGDMKLLTLGMQNVTIFITGNKLFLLALVSVFCIKYTLNCQNEMKHNNQSRTNVLFLLHRRSRFVYTSIIHKTAAEFVLIVELNCVCYHTSDHTNTVNTEEPQFTRLQDGAVGGG